MRFRAHDAKLCMARGFSRPACASARVTEDAQNVTRDSQGSSAGRRSNSGSARPIGLAKTSGLFRTHRLCVVAEVAPAQRRLRYSNGVSCEASVLYTMDAALSRGEKRIISIPLQRESGGYNSEALLVYGLSAC